MYKELNIEKILSTIAKLNIRIDERFPESSVSRVCSELYKIGSNAKNRINDLIKSNNWVRGGVVAVIIVFLSALIYTFNVIKWEFSQPSLAEIIQITEALINDVLLVSAALFFLITFEQRIKRRKVLKELHLLRSIAHVIDMHQLTKDPSMVITDLKRTDNSPVRNMTADELLRYLDYCSEMFSLIGKIAALFSERLPEPSIVSAANDIETLCTGLSKKVWQKMVFLGKN
jgi:hypothetical protein